MYRKLMFLISLVALLVLVNGTYAADILWDGGGADDSFCTPENWEGDVLPGLADRAEMEYIPGANYVVVDCDATVNNFRFPDSGGDPGLMVCDIVSGGHLNGLNSSRTGDSASAELNISGTGMLTVDGEYRFYDDGTEGWLNLSDNGAIVVTGRWRMGDGTQTVHINVSGGTIYVGDEYWRLGDDGGGTVDISGGSINVNGQIRWICRENTQIITVTGGEQWCSSTYQVGGSTGGKDAATYCEMNMSGGIINCGEAQIGGGYEDTTMTITGGRFISRSYFLIRNPANDITKVNLGGNGVIEIAGNLLVEDGGNNLEIISDDARIILDGNKLGQIFALVDAGKLTACGSPRGIVADYGVTNPGKTTVRRDCDFDECQAWAPNPANGAIEVQSVITEVILSWREGDCLGLRGRNALYFGDDEALVDAATPADPEFVQYHRAGETTHNIGNIPLWETRYWRVDELNTLAGKPPTTKGAIWSFTTGCAAIVGDLNMDCLVNFLDYAELADSFGGEEFWPD
jgi:hypothetical protein